MAAESGHSHMPAPPRGGCLGLGMGFLLLVGAVVAWTTVAGLRSSRLTANERSAAGWIRSLASAEAEFRGKDLDGNGVQDFWTADVAGLHRFGLIDRSLAEADAQPLVPLAPTPIPKDGHYYRALEMDESGSPPEAYRQDTDPKSGKVHHLRKFGFCVYPAEMGVTGRHVWIVNQDNTALRSNDGIKTPLPPKNWPSDQDLRKWSKVQ